MKLTNENQVLRKLNNFEVKSDLNFYMITFYAEIIESRK